MKMTTRGLRAGFTSLRDFSDKCRICLKNFNDMIDIFASGISNQMMEVTNIKISDNDKLPRNMCQDCSIQLKESHKFQCLAKDSDQYLRTLLKTEEDSPDNLTSKNNQKKKRKIHRKLVRLKKTENTNENSDKMYIILVTESSKDIGSQNEICIKDLDGENENAELTNLCKSLIKNQSCDNDDHEGVFNKTEIGLIKDNNDKDVYKVNLFIYNCRECDESFEFEDLLTQHTQYYHKTQVSNMSFNYTCPVCFRNEFDKNIFTDHLMEHKKDGFTFFKVNGSGNCVSLTENEKEIFEVPKFNESIIRNKIFKISMSCFTCALCKKVESIDSVNEHLSMCFPGYEKNDNFLLHTKYSCPVCSQSWIDNIEAMNTHLASHKMDDIFFVKVNDSGEAIPLTGEDTAYTEFEKALEVLSGNNEDTNCDRTKIIKMQDFNLCVVCDFQSDSGTSLSEHYMEIHDKVMPTTKMPCPVCDESFRFMDESVTFLDHLKNHKSEGFVFLKVNKDGTVNGGVDNSGLFSNLSELFNGTVRCSELEFIKHVYVPEVFLELSSNDDSQNMEFPAENDGVDSKIEEENRTNREYVCEKCGRKCFGRGNYKRHFMTHAEKTDISTTSKRPSCSVCGKTFSNRSALNEHTKHHENTGSDVESGRKICEICGRRFSNNASLAKHRKLHVTNRESSLLKCKICGRGFRREPALKRHVSYHLNPNYFECEVCKLPLPSSASLQRHKLWHQGSSNTYDCKVCKVSFLTKDRLTAHQTQTGHHQDRKRFECNVCHERFFIGREFSQHIKLHPKYKMSECSLCGKRLSTMQSLMLHLSRHFESNSILCPHCGKLFFEERNYHRHLLTHKGVKPFSCDFEGCKKSFYTYFELNRHKKYHNNTRDFSCPYCPKCFHEANHLKVHIRTHTGERPYTCPHCNKGFVTRTRCKQHINLIHQGVGCDLIQSNISKKVAVFEALETVA